MRVQNFFAKPQKSCSQAAILPRATRVISFFFFLFFLFFFGFCFIFLFFEEKEKGGLGGKEKERGLALPSQRNKKTRVNRAFIALYQALQGVTLVSIFRRCGAYRGAASRCRPALRELSYAAAKSNTWQHFPPLRSM